jgi:protein-S-isoprenylcysteine O-methyltransferase Ste14
MDAKFFSGRQPMKLAPGAIAVVAAAAVLLVVGLAIAAIWSAIGESDISIAGWLAMGLGVIVTLGLGIGLMALIFISSRRGYDDGGRRR